MKMWIIICISVVIASCLILPMQSADPFCQVSVKDLRVYNWDLKLLILQWDVESEPSFCSGELEFEVTLQRQVGANVNNITMDRTAARNLTYRGFRVCSHQKAYVRPFRNGDPAGPQLSLDLREIFHGDDLSVHGIDVDYSEDSQLVMWQRGSSVCIDAYGISYKGRNVSSQRELIKIPIQRNWYRINENTADLDVIEMRPLHRGVAILNGLVTRVNVTSHNEHTTCYGRSPGAIREFTKNNIYSLTPQYWHLHWNICHYKTFPVQVEDTKYLVETSPPCRIDFRMRSEDLSKEYVFLNISDICKHHTISVSATRNEAPVGSKMQLPVATYLFMDPTIHGFKVTRLTSNLITLRWQRARTRASFNCSALYEIELASSRRDIDHPNLVHYVTGNNFTWRGDVSKFREASVQLKHAAQPAADPTRINLTEYFSSGSNTAVDRLRVASVRTDSVRFEWPEFKSDVTTEYRVRLTKGNETLEVMTSDLDFEWEGDPCLLHYVTAQPIQNGRPVGEPGRLNLTTYFYEDARGIDVKRRGRQTDFFVSWSAGRHCITDYILKAEPGGHTTDAIHHAGFDVTIVTLSIMPCEVTSASVHPVYKGQPVFRPTFFNLTSLRFGNIPKLNVTVEEYSKELFLSWQPLGEQSAWQTFFSKCPQDVEVRINVTSDSEFHSEVVHGTASDKLITGLVPCRNYSVRVSTMDGFVHYSKIHIIPSPDDVGVDSIKQKNVQGPGATLELSLTRAQGDCLPEVDVQCHPPLPPGDPEVALRRGDALHAVLQLAALRQGETYYCTLAVAGARQPGLPFMVRAAAPKPDAKTLEAALGTTDRTLTAKTKIHKNTVSGWSLFLAAAVFVVIGVTIVYHRSVHAITLNALSHSKTWLNNCAGRIINAKRIPSQRLIEEELNET